MQFVQVRETLGGPRLYLNVATIVHVAPHRVAGPEYAAITVQDGAVYVADMAGFATIENFVSLLGDTQAAEDDGER